MKITAPLHYPVRFLEAMALVEADPIAIIQQIVNGISFYTFFYGEGIRRKEYEEIMFLDRLKDYQMISGDKIGSSVVEISAFYLGLLKILQAERDLSEIEKVERSIPIFKEWESEVKPLLDYPDEVTFIDGRKVKLAFEYNLICITCDLTPDEGLAAYLNGGE